MHRRDRNKEQQLDCGGRKRGLGCEKQEEQEWLWQRKSRRRKLKNGKAARKK